jgi:H/ACA ribonucleoprotein complex subunit 3
MTHIRYCPHCQTYTMQQQCKRCTNQTISKHPARFSIQDHYGKYRRALKKLGDQE